MAAFHVSNNVYFQPLEDGRVEVFRVNKCQGPGWEREDRETILTMPAESWASVVSHVSARGETGETFRAALDFHKAEPAAPEETESENGSEEPEPTKPAEEKADASAPTRRRKPKK